MRQSFCLPLAALPVVALLLTTACHEKEEESAATPVVVAVKTAKAEAGTLQLALKAPATIFPLQRADIASRITAPIRNLLVKKGDEVKANQVLAILDGKEMSNYILTWDVLQQQQAELRANITKAEKELEQLKNASGSNDGEHARNLERAKNLATSLLTQQLPQNEAQLRSLEIRSPLTGAITEQFQYPGDIAKPDSPLFTVMDLSTVTARAQVPEAAVARIRKGMPCQFTSVESGAEPATGRITMINKAIDPQRRAIEVWCEIPNRGYKLRAGTFGDVRVVTGESSGIMVPESAVQFLLGTRNGSVIVVDADKTTHRREIEAGEVQDGKVQILKGLTGGESVVSEGGYGLPDNVKVTLSTSDKDKPDDGDKTSKGEK